MTLDEADAVIAAVRVHGSVKAWARASGISRQTLQSRVKVARSVRPGVLPEVGKITGWASGQTSRVDARGMPIYRRSAGSDTRTAAERGDAGGPPVPVVARPPPGFAITRNAAAYDADGNLTKQWIGTKRAAGETYEPSPGQVLKGESTLLDPEGRVLARWVKTREGAGDMLINALHEVFAEYDGLAPHVLPPSDTDADTLTVYPVPDLHLGMLSWGAETGADYDIKIAIEVATGTIAELVRQSRPSTHATLIVLGDYMHANDQRNVTPSSGHQLDVDGRHAKAYHAGATLALSLVSCLAAKHEHVEVVVLPGNHDPEASVTLSVALSLYYSADPRITVNASPSLAWYRRFGNVLLGAHHGHTMKPDRAAMAMATDRHEDWGQAQHRHIFTGHFHTERMTEVGNVRIETLQSPAARDAWNTASGYRSGRSLSAITFHKERGEVGRHRVSIGVVQ